MSTLSWDDSTKTWSWTGFSTKTNNSYYDSELELQNYNQWGYSIKTRPIGSGTWSYFFNWYDHVSGGTFSYNMASYPQYQPVVGYEYQGYRINETGYEGSETYSYEEPSNIIAPLGGGVTPLDIQMKSVDGLSETTVLATVIGGVVIHAISGKADALGETTVLTTLGNTTLISGIANSLTETTVIAEIITSTLSIAGKVDALGETTVLIDIMPILNISGMIDALSSVYNQVNIIFNLNFYLTGTATINGVVTPKIEVIALKTDKTKIYSTISNADGSFSIYVGEGSYHILGIYDDGNGNKYASLITPYVEVA